MQSGCLKTTVTSFLHQQCEFSYLYAAAISWPWYQNSFDRSWFYVRLTLHQELDTECVKFLVTHWTNCIGLCVLMQELFKCLWSTETREGLNMWNQLGTSSSENLCISPERYGYCLESVQLAWVLWSCSITLLPSIAWSGWLSTVVTSSLVLSATKP